MPLPLSIFLIYLHPLPQIILSIMPGREQIIMISPVEVPLNAGIPSVLFLVGWSSSPSDIYSARVSTKLQDTHTIIGQFESLESSLSYWVEICFPIIPPTESGCACWNFRKLIYLLSTCHPFKCLQATSMSAQCLLIWHRWWDTCLVLLLKGAKKQQPSGLGRFTKNLPVSYSILSCLE